VRVAVTGGAGFIGSTLVDALLARGDEVHVVDDLSAGKTENVPQGATLHVQDIRNPLAAVFAGTHFGNATFSTRCAPLSVCVSRMRARSLRGNSAASLTSAGHTRSCAKLILPSTTRQTSTSGASRSARVAAKIARPFGCDHQLP